MIEFENVNFIYQNAPNDAGVHDITLSIPQGQIILLCGGSGCGKTTLTRMINGLIPHFYEGEMDGTVTVCGNITADKELHELAPFVGSVFQNPKSQFYTVKTDTEIVFACENVGMPKEQILANFEQIVNELDISALLGKSLFSVSGGEKQKIACASVAALRPPIIVMDEPTSNLDMRTISYLKRIIHKWKSEGKTVIIAEHRLYWLMDVADRVIYMRDGRIEQDLSIDEFRQYSVSELHQMGLRNSATSENVMYDYQLPNQWIEFKNFCFAYKNTTTEALHIDTLRIPKGAVIGVLGNNGAGKTTFGRCLCGLEKRVTGSLTLDTKTLNRKQRIALSYIVMQDVNHQLFTESVMDEVLLSMEKQVGTEKEKETKALSILQRLKLLEFKDCHPMSLSGGQKQRVAIASALASGKEILVYDEPTSGLDYRHMLDVAGAIREMKKMNNTQFIITHDAELVSYCCDYIILMENGVVAKHGPLRDKDICAAVSLFWRQSL